MSQRGPPWRNQFSWAPPLPLIAMQRWLAFLPNSIPQIERLEDFCVMLEGTPRQDEMKRREKIDVQLCTPVVITSTSRRSVGRKEGNGLIVTLFFSLPPVLCRTKQSTRIQETIETFPSPKRPDCVSRHHFPTAGAEYIEEREIIDNSDKMNFVGLSRHLKKKKKVTTCDEKKKEIQKKTFACKRPRITIIRTRIGTLFPPFFGRSFMKSHDSHFPWKLYTHTHETSDWHLHYDNKEVNKESLTWKQHCQTSCCVPNPWRKGP